MRPFKFLHMADLHMDIPFTSLACLGNSGHERRLEQKLLFKKIIEIAENKEVDAILIAGDLFEHEYVSRSSISFINECFKAIEHIKIFISPGNHDPYIKNSYYLTYKWASNVHIFGAEIQKVILQGFNTCIYGIGFNDFLIYESKLKDFKVEDEEKINIMVVHGTIENLSGTPGYHPISTSVLEKSGLDYTALGHIHKYNPQILKGKACYPGSAIALGFDEPGQHGIIIGQADKHNIHTEFIPVDIRQYITQEINIESCNTYQGVVEQITKNIHGLINTNNYYKLVINGMVKSRIIENLELIEKMLYEEILTNKVNIKFNLLPEYEYTQIALGNDLKALFVKEVLAKIEKETDAEQKKRLKSILHIGLNAIEGKKVKPL